MGRQKYRSGKTLAFNPGSSSLANFDLPTSESGSTCFSSSDDKSIPSNLLPFPSLPSFTPVDFAGRHAALVLHEFIEESTQSLLLQARRRHELAKAKCALSDENVDEQALEVLDSVQRENADSVDVKARDSIEAPVFETPANSRGKTRSRRPASDSDDREQSDSGNKEM